MVRTLSDVEEGMNIMIFDLEEDHIMIRKMVRDFAESECRPGAGERDENEEFPREIWNKLAELGLAGITFPEEYGGVGADYISYAIAVEELSRVDASVGVTVSAHSSLCCNPIHLFGTANQKQKYLTDLAQGKKLGALGLTEAMAGSDASATRTTAVREGNEYVINGSKIFITNGFEADTYVVTAQMDKSKGNKGIAAFIMEKGMPGFTFGKKEKKMGIRSSATYELVFNNVRIPVENLLGEEGQGFKIAMVTLDFGRIGIASQALGIAQGAYEEALNYAKERVQFGKSLSEFQINQFKLADMATQIEAARLLVYQSAYLASQHRPVSKASAMAKLYAAETAMWVTTQAVQIHGGYGYTREYPVERMMRDAKITEIYEGTSEIQRIVIANHIIRES